MCVDIKGCLKGEKTPIYNDLVFRSSLEGILFELLENSSLYCVKKLGILVQVKKWNRYTDTEFNTDIFFTPLDVTVR